MLRIPQASDAYTHPLDFLASRVGLGRRRQPVRPHDWKCLRPGHGSELGEYARVIASRGKIC